MGCVRETPRIRKRSQHGMCKRNSPRKNKTRMGYVRKKRSQHGMCKRNAADKKRNQHGTCKRNSPQKTKEARDV